jgi:hypothetical protein
LPDLQPNSPAIRQKYGEKCAAAVDLQPTTSKFDRLLEQESKAECRPGVSWQSTEVDLGGEFQRQFLGDLMLFTVEQLAGQGYPEQGSDVDRLDGLLESVIEDMQAKYSAQAAANLALAAELRALWQGWRGTSGAWSQTLADAEIWQRMEAFIDNLERTFSAQVGLSLHVDAWRTRLKAGLLDYPKAQRAWRRLVGQALSMESLNNSAIPVSQGWLTANKRASD